CYRFVPVKRQT
ncbi:hypothetical protein D047_2619B, partial [Vibrio parahaemolyticus VPTS-2010_2]